MAKKSPARLAKHRVSRAWLNKTIIGIVAVLMILGMAAYYLEGVPAPTRGTNTGVAPSTPGAVLDRANQAYDARDYVTAVKLYDEVLKANPNDVGVLTDQGTAYFYKQPSEPDKAIADYDRAIKADPRFKNARVNKGVVLREAKHDFSGAIATWQDALRILPPGDPDTEKVKGLIAETQKMMSAIKASDAPAGAQAPSPGPTADGQSGSAATGIPAAPQSQNAPFQGQYAPSGGTDRISGGFGR